MDKLKPTPHATRCRCGNTLPKAATARWDSKDRLWYDCHICRPRPDPRDPAPEREGLFRDHNCWACDNGRLPCKNKNSRDCDNLIARND
jgi:hypothetical protein